MGTAAAQLYCHCVLVQALRFSAALGTSGLVITTYICIHIQALLWHQFITPATEITATTECSQRLDVAYSSLLVHLLGCHLWGGMLVLCLKHSTSDNTSRDFRRLHSINHDCNVFLTMQDRLSAVYHDTTLSTLAQVQEHSTA